MNCLTVILLLCLTFTCDSLAATLHVAVASNFRKTLESLADTLADSSDCQLLLSSGSTGSLYAQIMQGAPYDVFLAADSYRPVLLEENGHGVAGSRVVYAIGRLALWSSVSLPDVEMIAWLQSARVKHIAMANPKTAPYGRAAREWLDGIGLWKQLQEKFVFGENISQTFQFAAGGAAECGLVAVSQVISYEGMSTGQMFEIPVDQYGSIEQQAILLIRAVKSDCAREFMQFLESADCKEFIKRSGYRTVVRESGD
jgi:molybdate transport system substrate-binding protein